MGITFQDHYVVDRGEDSGSGFLAGQLGELTQVIAPVLVDDVLGVTRRVQCRVRKLPSRLVDYFVLALSLSGSDGYQGVWAALTASFAGRQRMSPSETALRHARRRVDGGSSGEVTVAGHAARRRSLILFLIMRTAGGGPRGGTPLSGPSPPGAGVVLATSQGQLVIVAANMIPASVASELGIAAGAFAMAMSGGPRDKGNYEEKYGDVDENDMPRLQRISDGNTQELELGPGVRGGPVGDGFAGRGGRCVRDRE